MSEVFFYGKNFLSDFLLQNEIYRISPARNPVFCEGKKPILRSLQIENEKKIDYSLFRKMDIVIKLVSEKTFPKSGGKIFEKFVLENLQTSNVKSLTSREITNLGIDKSLVLTLEQKEISLNKKDDVYYCYEPFGSQSFPDFLFIYRSHDNIFKLFTLELKSAGTKRPVWNCSLPFPSKHHFYLFLRVGGEKKKWYYSLTTGDKLIPLDVYNILHKHAEDEDYQKKTERVNALVENWSYYSRPMYNQKFDFPVTDENDCLEILREIYGDDYSIRTLKYISKHSKEERSAKEEFFTRFGLVYDIFTETRRYLPENMENKDISVLEPSSGTGQFLDIFSCFYNVDHCELCEGTDFLLHEFDKKYDLIVGNPPYSEDCSKYESKLKKFRYNMYALFVEKAIDMLNEEGVLCFVIPPAILSAPSFDLLREYINSCGVRLVFRKDVDKFSNEIGQMTSICIWKKFTNIIEEKVTEAAKTLGNVAVVKIGSIVWNQVKQSLRNEIDSASEENGKMLLYSPDVALYPKLSKLKGEKKRFVVTAKSALKLPVILMSRTKVPRFTLIKSCDIPLISENHTISIHPKEGQDIDELYSMLCSEKTKEFCLRTGGTLNFSKSQTEKIEIS
jgi:Eco57I restriction-modification methylase